MLLLAAIHAVATLMMSGLIWFVQLVHYPSFAAVGEQAFQRFHRQHLRRTTWIVAPLMITEAATATGLTLLSRGLPYWNVTLLGVILLAAIWASTAFIQVPCHNRLGEGFDATAVRRLVRTNWIRTIAWTARGVLAVLIVKEMRT